MIRATGRSADEPVGGAADAHGAPDEEAAAVERRMDEDAGAPADDAQEPTADASASAAEVGATAVGPAGPPPVDAAVPGPEPTASIPTRPRRTRRTRGTPAAEPEAGPAAVPVADARVVLRLARLHLRMGQLQLARAQLEALAGRGELDEASLLDLAEARWRTGDLAGAGEAAGALLAHGREDGLALIIGAESVAALGRPGEARRMANRALAVTIGPLDAIFAGMPRNAIWPEDPVPSTADGDASAAASAADHSAAGSAPDHAGHPGHVSRPRHALPTGEGEGPTSAAAAEAFAGGRAALARGDTGLATLRLGVAMRLDPEFAEGVLDAVGSWDRDPALALVAGDALRLLGRESEALAAFDRARDRP